jgi:hypothetical protein
MLDGPRQVIRPEDRLTFLARNGYRTKLASAVRKSAAPVEAAALSVKPDFSGRPNLSTGRIGPTGD